MRNHLPAVFLFVVSASFVVFGGIGAQLDLNKLSKVRREWKTVEGRVIRDSLTSVKGAGSHRLRIEYFVDSVRYESEIKGIPVSVMGRIKKDNVRLRTNPKDYYDIQIDSDHLVEFHTKRRNDSLFISGLSAVLAVVISWILRSERRKERFKYLSN